MAQTTFSYESSWKKVDAAFNNGKPKTAEEELDKIYARAKAENNEPQLVKAIVYKSRAVQMVEEDSWVKNIRFFEKEIKAAQEPVKQILYSITAGLYQNYFQNQRWKIYNRTATNDADPNNPETWSVTDFNARISAYYEKSLSNQALLQKTKLDKYGAILVEGNMRHLRPTLFDLLAHEALDYWENEESEITKPVYAFVPDQAALAPTKIFIKQQYESKDSSSHILKAIKLYQELLRFHLDDEKPDALVDVDIARVQFAHQKAEFEGKEQLYKEALEHIYTQYQKNEQAMQAGNLLVRWWKQKGENYNPATGTEEDKMALAIALEYAEKVDKAFPKSEGGILAGNLVMEIKKPSLSVQVENVNVINKPFMALLSFKTLGTVYFRLVKLPSTFNEDDGYNEEEEVYWARVTSLTAIRSWKQNVPSYKDYRGHSAEIKIDGLPIGRYLLLASADESFSTGKNQLASAITYVSNISFVQSGQHYFVLNRDNGKALPEAKVQVWYSRYDYNKRRTILNKGELLVTDKNGYVQPKTLNNGEGYYGDMRLEITGKNDYLFLADAMQRTYSGNRGPDKTAAQYELDRAHYYFFTDRAIYRPGQTLYFKAIGLTADAQNGKPKLFKPANVEVILRNANYEQVASLKFTPNEFASFNGNFLLPMSGLTGVFQLEIKKDNRTWNKTIRVEEYKRPKFFVEYKPIEGTYKLNKEITVQGMAKGYAGNNIDGAQVSYRVKRATRYLYPWYFRGGYWPPRGGDEMEITNGTTITKPDGSFDISFTAIPDLSVDAKLDPSFDYTIEAVVTDINGEVRSEETTISVGYKSLVLSLNTGGQLMRPADSTIALTVEAANLNGKPQASEVKLKIIALQNPGRMLRERLWDTPDTSVYSKADFEKWFPNDPFANEDDYRNWEEAKTVVSTTLKTPSAAGYHIKPGTLAPGYYRIEAASEDSDGKEVKTIDFIAIFDTKSGQLPAPAYLVDYSSKNTVEPGQQAVFWQGTTLPDAFVVQQTIKKTNQPLASISEDQDSFEYLNTSKGFQPFSFHATENDRGGYLVNRVMVYNNRVYTQSWMVNVPWSNKELNISFETFRDKLQPGENETWTVKISGAKGEQAAIEMLASMYDASLDPFAPHAWENVNPWTNNTFYNRWVAGRNFEKANVRDKTWYDEYKGFDKRYEGLISVDSYYRGEMKFNMLSGRVAGVQVMPNAAMDEAAVTTYNKQGEMYVMAEKIEVAKFTPPKIVNDEEVRNEEMPGKQPGNDFENITIRKNFNETAFFFPDLKTDGKGNISFSFTMPEALTQWKLQLLGHTVDARFASATKTIVTQKQLMVIPNAPRFFRQGDQMEFSVKISNLSDKEMTGQAQLEMLNASTMQPVDGWFKNVFPNQYFTLAAGQSTALKFPIEIPFLFNDAVVYRVVAKASPGGGGLEGAGDGEEMALPVLTNRMLVTESFPLNLRGTDSKTFTWQRFMDMAATGEKSGSLDHHSMTVEYTTNPAWYAVQSLPYIMEYPYDCAEQTWNRFYANALAGKIANSSPRIKAIFESWKNKTPDALLSNLQKNPELKSALLEETPWVMDAKNEADQKKNIGLLFDLVRMNNEAESAMNKLKELQSSNGGFVWFKGGRDDRYMTQYILTGMGHLRKLNAWPEKQQQVLKTLVAKAIPYADARIKEEYEELLKSKVEMKTLAPSSFVTQFLYMRSFYPEIQVTESSKKAVAYFTGQAKAYWTKLGKYEQGMVALALYRSADHVTPKSILSSLTENSISNEEFGMYWKEFNNPGWYWWQAPIESHALLMEAYNEIENNAQRVDDLKTWLLKQKQTTNWKTTKATAEACYALLMRGTDWLSEERTVTIDLGGYKMSSANSDKTEAGTGYFKQVVTKEKIAPDMGKIKVQLETSKKDNTTQTGTTSWGAVYWQYFEDLDKITTAGSPVSIKKELYVQRNTDRGPVLEILKEDASLKVGDRVKVRVEIKSDRNLEYVHLKDMRASCFEPLNVLSSYKWQGGLGYYEATKDASSNFFIGYLPRGTYVFEYELRTTLAGDFSNGITTLQCMYAPEFSSHSKGVRVKVGEVNE